MFRENLVECCKIPSKHTMKYVDLTNFVKSYLKVCRILGGGKEACYSVDKVLQNFPTFSISPMYGRRKCYSRREFGMLCRILRPLQGCSRAFCRIVGISRISCTIPRRRSHASCPIYTLRPPQTPKCLDLQVSPCYYTTWQNLAEFVELLQSLPISATFRHRFPLTTPNYGVICRKLWYS